MVCKKLFITFTILLLFSLNNLFSQTEKELSQNKEEVTLKNQEENIEETETTAEENWQKLEWEDEEPFYVSYYKVIIEEYEEKTNSFKLIKTLQTEDNTPFVKVSPILPPGVYRFKVITYDLIKLPSSESDWFNFSIYQAKQPEVNDVKAALNLSSTLYLEEYNDGIFNITGINLLDTQKDFSDISYSSYRLEKKGRTRKDEEIIVPTILEKDDKFRKLKVQFNLKDLDVGTYNFVVQDASGLLSKKTSKNEISIKFKKRIDFNTSVGYTLPVILFDDTLPNYLNKNILPFSFLLKTQFIPFKHNFGYFGLGLQASYSNLTTTMNNYKITGNLFNAQLNFIYQLPIRLKVGESGKTRHAFTLELHGGASASYFNDVKFTFQKSIKSNPLNSLNIGFDAGGSVQIFINNRLYTELCADFVMAVCSDMVLGMIQPSISIGWQF